jgi:riboflavin transporter FmnP
MSERKNKSVEKNGTKPVVKAAHWSARQLATMALFIALGLILSFIEFPLLPGTDFLKYDASSVPALLAGFTYGPVAGCLVGVITALVHAFFTGNFWGALMNIGVVIAFVLPISLIYKYSLKSQQKKNTLDNTLVPGANVQTMQTNAKVPNTLIIVGLVLSCVLTIAAAIVMNLVVTPIYMGVPRAAVIGMILPILLPFNILKAIINSVLGFVLLKSLRSFLR